MIGTFYEKKKFKKRDFFFKLSILLEHCLAIHQECVRFLLCDIPAKEQFIHQLRKTSKFSRGKKERSRKKNPILERNILGKR